MKQLFLFEPPTMRSRHKEIIRKIENIDKVARAMRAAGCTWYFKRCQKEIQELFKKLNNEA